ncbi:hypothetical protein HDU97_006087 [Phlyctochytrium planicorne]|nr:hypothetical protein HDU97_006087 [Phlyctochytrium planicorne]
MKFHRALSLLAAACAGANAVSIRSTPGITIPAAGPASIKGAYLIELEGVYDCESHVKNFLQSEHKVNSEDITTRQVISTNLFNGVSIHLSEQGDNDDDLITSIPGVVSIRRVNLIPIPKPVLQSAANGSTVLFEDVHSITGVNEARTKFGLTGKGVKVAETVIDSGVFYTHPALGGGFGPAFKVSFGYDLVGDDFAPSLDQPAVPDSDPLDNCSEVSHGTHVSGIIAGDARNITDPYYATEFPFTGVAPGATLGAYRVFSCVNDDTGDDVIAAAIYKAAADGADIINMSLGGPPDYNDGSDSIAVNRVSEAGVIVFSAAGNEAASGMFSTGAPGIASKGFGIASFDNLKAPSPELVFENVSYIYNTGSQNSNFAFEAEYEIVVNNLDADDLDIQDDGSAVDSTVNATGKALLIRFGDTAYGGSIKRCGYAVRAGAVACLLYSSSAGALSGIYGAAEIPSLYTTQEAGRAIIASIKAGRKSTIVVSESLFLGTIPTGGTISSFSSGGLDPELNLKPDVGGIGGLVYSTISQHVQKLSNLKSPYAVYSGEDFFLLLFHTLLTLVLFLLSKGTSMATPYAVGVAALILEAYKTSKPTFDAIKVLLQNTATVTKAFGTNDVESAAFQGAGLINAYKALTTKTLVTPSSISLNDTEFTQKWYEITVTNLNNTAQEYTITHQPARAVAIFADPTIDDAMLSGGDQEYFPEYSKVSFGDNKADIITFSLEAGKSKKVKVFFSSTTKLFYPIHSGYLVISSYAEKAVSVPYAGIVGKWKAARIWSRNSPYLFTSVLQDNSAAFENFGVNVPETLELKTGVYFNHSSLSLLNEPATCLNLTKEFALVAPVAVTNSRLAKVEIIFKGNAKEAASWKAVGLNPNLPYLLYAKNQASFDGLSTFNVPTTLLFTPLIRQSYVSGVQLPTLYLWSGYVEVNSTYQIPVPKGSYQIRFAAQRHFTKLEPSINTVNYDVVTTPIFSIVY